MTGLISLVIAFTGIITLYIIATMVVRIAIKQSMGLDLKPWIKKSNPVFVMLMVIWMATVVLFTFPWKTDAGSEVLPTAPVDVAAVNAPIVTNTLAVQQETVSKEAKEDADKALSDARSLFRSNK